MSWTKQLWKKPMLKAEPILKEEPLKKDLMRWTSPDGTTSYIDQDVGEIHGQIKKDYISWKNKCQSLRGKRIGVTGGSGYKTKTDKDDKITWTSKPPNKEFKNTLYEHITNHVTAAVSRKNEQKDYFMDALENFEKILGEGKEGSLITEEDIEAMESFKDELIKMFDKGGSGKNSPNPRNIPFTVPKSLIAYTTKKGIKRWKVQEDHIVYGHYRTPKYVQYRNKVKGDKTEIKAVPKSWWSKSPNESKPPMYQAIFSGSSLDETTSTLLKGKGLLGIVEVFWEDLKNVKLKEINTEVNASGSNAYKAKKVEILSKFTPLVSEIESMLKNPMYFRKDKRKNKLIASNFLRDVNSLNFDVKGKQRNSLVEAFADIDNLVGSDSIENVNFKLTLPVVSMLINTTIRTKGKEAMKAPDSDFPFILPSDSKTRTRLQGQLADWFDELMEEAIAKQKQVKKSWVDSLWS